ncbi:hypothetical protein LEP1GSC050_1716 [Leptospira broomii serovar Hurstbridge str. 5399]|uniref:Uncharacterized protein n=1 Tax=Leptospira broomii serovar Hurstbridge str. 5399 TaxID=1049789 RepID=T0F7R8_9LEPT|nr:hypothetical protein LEP1GSC050_1716 [Leptospira broomii serovar Hurstbridge str. 5399]
MRYRTFLIEYLRIWFRIPYRCFHPSSKIKFESETKNFCPPLDRISKPSERKIPINSDEALRRSCGRMFQQILTRLLNLSECIRIYRFKNIIYKFRIHFRI